MHRADATVDDAVLRKKEQKDVELDKKILALRKKNEALIRRYQEIEEDKKRAEQEGMAVTSRRPKQDGLTITITKAHNDLKDAITQTEHYGQDSPVLLMDKRVVSEKWGSPCSTSPGLDVGSEEDEEEEEEADHMFTFRMGKRMQLAVTMDNKAKGKRIVSEKRAECFGGPGRVPELNEEEMNHLVAFRRGRRMQIAITMDKKEKAEERRTAEKRRSESNRAPESDHGRKEGGKSAQKGPGDLSFPMSGRERSEYMRWKRERDQIDLERLARHKNAKGEWRRAWDVEKSEHMFEEDFVKDGEPALDNPSNKKGGRSTRKFQHRAFPHEGRGGGQHSVNVSDAAPRAAAAMGSRARGKDRLTGRARRWDAKEGDDMSFLKDDPDSQQILSTDKLRGRGEERVEDNCPGEPEKARQPSLSDPEASSSQELPSRKVPAARNSCKEEARAVKEHKEVPVATSGDTEPGSTQSEEGAGTTSGAAGIPSEQEGLGGTAETSSLPLSLEGSTASEGESSSNSAGGKLGMAAGGRWEARPMPKGGEEASPNRALEGQALALKGGEGTEGTEHRAEPLPSMADSSSKTVGSEQDTTESPPSDGDQAEGRKDEDSGDSPN
ncbi:coiled-coil domain-containing protein 9B [Nothoprocta perdicaria]|uniref:coiled-coil domain-containing protein 9B n=1 Tax=Nothoprocta perdicaria TaxID=30464 RepID=UPI000E1B7C3F|nr:coiled-coil domain-containing protein 9B [Nothoprocta perdicaria]